MNDAQLPEKKVNNCKRRISLLCSFFLLGMLFMGAYISNLPYELAILAIAVLVVCFALIVWNSIKIKKIKTNDKSVSAKSGLFICVFYFLILLFFQMEVSEKILSLFKDMSFWNQYMDLIFYPLFAVIIIFAFHQNLVLEFQELIRKREEYIKYILVVFIFTVVSMVLSAIILSGVNIGKSANEELVEESLINNPILMWIVVCIIGPFVEENIFREIIYQKIRNTLKNKWGMYLSIFLSSLVFMLYHYDLEFLFSGDYQQLLALLPIFFMGVGLAALYEITSNIFCPLIVHMALNILASSG